MNEILSTLLTLLPPKQKTTPSGWTSFNAVCCHHNGQSKDTRKRGGILINQEQGFQYHCFNCNFKCGWSPGKNLTNNTKKLFRWLGLSDPDVGRLNLFALKTNQNLDSPIKLLNFDLKEIELPDQCQHIDKWLQQDCQDPDLLSIIDYVVNQRGMEWDWWDWMWSPSPGFKDRVIIPFYQNGHIVGYTGRKITDGKPKYLTMSQSGYVFNIDRQSFDRKFVIVTEGQFDAIAIDGVAIMTNEPNDTQIARINKLNRQVICVPDQDAAGSKILKECIKQNWSVSCPPWGPDIKDVADAVKKFGRLYTLVTILHYRIQGEIKIQLLKNKLQNIHD